MSADEMACDCEPEIHGDGSVSHEPDCAIYPWCPHEVGVYSCDVPCGCPCGPCSRLADAHARLGEAS